MDKNNYSEPLEYVRGFTEFLGCRIDLSKKPLIPRPETEFWLGEVLKNLKIKNLKIRCLDIFAGSGCIGIAVLKNIKNSEVVFSDNDKKCLEQIKINLKLNNVTGKKYHKSYDRKNYDIVLSDVFSGLAGQRFNFIFANPPYIPDYRKNPSARLRAILRNRVQKSVLNFEPKQALFGGADGLFYIKKFLRRAKNYLNPSGKIFMEFSPEQKKEIEKIIKKYRYSSYEFHKDQYGKWRWIMIK